MRTFSSYGTLNPRRHYYVQRTELINTGYAWLVGDDPEFGGHYLTVWAPRQTGKTWVMTQVKQKLESESQFDIVSLSLGFLEGYETPKAILQSLLGRIAEKLQKPLPDASLLDSEKYPDAFQQFFSKANLDRPLILILDEFDVLLPNAIQTILRVFRDIYLIRAGETIHYSEKSYLLHGVAVVGIRGVLGANSETGSPFNTQRSLHVPNLTHSEVDSMFHWYEQESGQIVEQSVIDRIYSETQGQPGLVGWLGELLTQDYNPDPNISIQLEHCERMLIDAVNTLGNNTITNLISKVARSPYREVVLELFQTQEKVPFKFDQAEQNFLYLNGVIDVDRMEGLHRNIKFANPVIQKRLFNYFSEALFTESGQIFAPFEDWSDTITENHLNIGRLIQRYEAYLHTNHTWIFAEAPRRRDLRLPEAIFHFNLYAYLTRIFQKFGGAVLPEFPTGNGKIDLLIRYANALYGLELKSFSTIPSYHEAISQAARYGQQLGLQHITLVFFVESINTENRTKYEVNPVEKTTGVQVDIFFVATGE